MLKSSNFKYLLLIAVVTVGVYFLYYQTNISENFPINYGQSFTANFIANLTANLTENFTDVLLQSTENNNNKMEIILKENIFEVQHLTNECPETPPNLIGKIKVFLESPSMEKLKTIYPNLKVGGHGQPIDCLARQRVAIIIPYRYVFGDIYSRT